MKNQKRLYSTMEAAEVLGISRHRIAYLIREGKVSPMRTGRNYCLSQTDMGLIRLLGELQGDKWQHSKAELENNKEGTKA